MGRAGSEQTGPGSDDVLAEAQSRGCRGAHDRRPAGDSFRFAVALLFGLGVSIAEAQQIFRTGIVDYPEGTPALGLGVYAGTDNYLGEKMDWDQVPLFLYEGRRAFAQGNTFGYRLIRSDVFEFAPIARGRIQIIDPTEVPELRRIGERRSTVEAGATATLKSPIGELQLTHVTDVLEHHDGVESDLTYRLPIRGERWTLTPWVSVLWQDAALTNYYYGVSEDESMPDRPAYLPGGATNVVYGLNASYALGKRGFLFANVGFEQIDTTIADSPIVESDSNTRGFIGASWVFGGKDPSRMSDSELRDLYGGEKPSLWTWRVHWSYQLKHNIFPLPFGGALNKSSVVPETTPTQFGLTLGRILRTSERFDLQAFGSVFRHHEEPFQEDFWSYNFGMSGVLKSYANHTDQVAFRWGAGVGLSYVESIPGQEVQFLVNYSRDFSKVLLYLEARWEFALDRLFKSELLDGCFLGYLVTHRSGIFGGSTVTGGVKGGSDWGGLHLECKI